MADPHSSLALQAVLYDIILKNFEKLKKPRGETKGMIY